jgi:phosphate starvation-inducible PhoH-like protein
LQTTKTKTKNPKEQIHQLIKQPKEKFLTSSQEEYWEILGKNQITICIGPAGTGKSYISLKKSIDLLWNNDNKYEKLIIIRPSIETGKSIGFLPGDKNEKMLPYIMPSYYLLDKIMGKNKREQLEKDGFIEVIPISFLRGWNIDNSIVVGEEFQNVTPIEMKLVLTRIGYNSKIFLSGDIEQSDLFKDKTKSGLFDAKERLKNVNDIGIFEFDENDIVRNPIISEIINRYNN